MTVFTTILAAIVAVVLALCFCMLALAVTFKLVSKIYPAMTKGADSGEERKAAL